MTVLAFVTEREVVREILDHPPGQARGQVLGLPSTGPSLRRGLSPHADLDAWQGDLALDDVPSAA